MAKVHIGSISTGTLKTEDLIIAFVEELTSRGGNLPPELACVEHLEYTDLPSMARVGVVDADDPFWESEDAGWDLEELTDALNEYCPPFVYFGSHPGDGADFGYWPDVDALEEEMRDAEDTADGDTKYLPEANVLVQVSDHGNIMVMDMDRKELWSCV